MIDINWLMGLPNRKAMDLRIVFPRNWSTGCAKGPDLIPTAIFSIALVFRPYRYYVFFMVKA